MVWQQHAMHIAIAQHQHTAMGYQRNDDDEPYAIESWSASAFGSLRTVRKKSKRRRKNTTTTKKYSRKHEPKKYKQQNAGTNGTPSKPIQQDASCFTTNTLAYGRMRCHPYTRDDQLVASKAYEIHKWHVLSCRIERSLGAFFFCIERREEKKLCSNAKKKKWFKKTESRKKQPNRIVITTVLKANMEEWFDTSIAPNWCSPSIVSPNSCFALQSILIPFHPRLAQKDRSQMLHPIIDYKQNTFVSYTQIHAHAHTRMHARTHKTSKSHMWSQWMFSNLTNFTKTHIDYN